MCSVNFMSMKNKNVLIFFIALFMGMGVNMGMLFVGSWLLPLPEGLNTSSREALKAALPLLRTQDFIFPFLAHAMGTLTSAFFVTTWATDKQLRYSLIYGGLFFLGGLTTIIGMPSPVWFSILDLTLAYFPMAWIGYKMAVVLGK